MFFIIKKQIQINKKFVATFSIEECDFNCLDDPKPNLKTWERRVAQRKKTVGKENEGKLNSALTEYRLGKKPEPVIPRSLIEQINWCIKSKPITNKKLQDFRIKYDKTWHFF